MNAYEITITLLRVSKITSLLKLRFNPSTNKKNIFLPGERETYPYPSPTRSIPFITQRLSNDKQLQVSIIEGLSPMQYGPPLRLPPDPPDSYYDAHKSVT